MHLPPNTNAARQLLSRAVYFRISLAPRTFTSFTRLSNSTPTANASTISEIKASFPRYYALFPRTLPNGPPPNGLFTIDLRALRVEYLALQAGAHPDVAAHTPLSSKTANHNNSSEINMAYRTLSDPLSRAQYLLRSQHHVDLEGDEAGSLVAVDAEALEIVMEAREVMEDAKSEKDLEGLRIENEGRIEVEVRALERAFGRGDVERAKRAVVRLRYWVNVREGIRGWERGRGGRVEH